MASTWSDLKIELIGTGDQSGTWGSTTNSNLGNDVLGAAIAGSADVTFSSADVTVTLTDTVAAQTARNLRLNLTGTTGGARNLILGSGCQIEKPYLINNGTADTITVKNTTGTGIAVPAGKSMWVYNNGTNVVDAVTHLTSLTLGSALPVASGGTGITSFGSGVATWLGTPSSANLASAMTDETGTGLLVFGTSPSLTTPKVITSINDTNGNELIGVTATGSAVNEITVANAAIGNNPVISATGDDTNIGINLTPKGTGRTTVTQLTTTSPRVLTAINDTNGNELIGVTATGSAVNEITVANAAIGNNPVISATGNDTNIGINLTPKGTGAIKLSGLSYPTADGSANQAITTNGSGVLSFASISTSAATPTARGTLYGSDTSGSPYTTAVGYNAGAVATGISNSFFGFEAGKGTTTGTNNIAVGYQALDANTIGVQNTAVGASALGANTTGTGNIAVGFQALLNKTTAVYNTAVGYDSQNTGATGNQNASLGYQALYNNTGSNNTAIGAGSMNNAANTGSNNTALGSGTLAANTASNNTAVGYQSLGVNTTGTSNVAVGYQSLYNNTTGANNTAVGYQALTANQTGDNNTAVGYVAFASNTTGSNSVALGMFAGNSHTTGVRNTFVGGQAGRNTTSATDNVAIGYTSLFTNTTGVNNVAVGVDALRLNTIASNNTAIGYQSLYSNTTGTDNTAVGYQAASGNTTGSENIAIGNSTLSSVTTGTRNVAVGHQALLGGSATSYNAILGWKAGRSVTSNGNVLIGYGAGFGTTPLTTGANNIHIGTETNPSANNVSNEIIVGYNGSTGKGTNTGFINPNSGGVYQGNNSSSWSTTSDRRLKKNIVDNNEGLDKISQIRVRNFEYRLPDEVDAELKSSDAVKKEGIQLGVIAQELQEVCPDCVKEESTGVLSVDSDNVFWHMLNAIKQLNTRLQAAEAEIATLKGA